MNAIQRIKTNKHQMAGQIMTSLALDILTFKC